MQIMPGLPFLSKFVLRVSPYWREAMFCLRSAPRTKNTPMTITITAEDIQRGRRCDPGCCPVGRAISRAGVEHYGVIGTQVMVPSGNSGAKALPLPHNVQNWLLDFDGCMPVEPISFELPIERAQRG